MTIEVNLNLIIWAIIILSITFFLGYLKAKRKEYDIRKDSNKRQRAVVNWEVFEKMYPLMWWMEYNPRDLVFIWKWVDYLIFNGLTDWHLKEIIFLELKTWKSNLNSNEKQVREVICSKKVKYEVKRH